MVVRVSSTKYQTREMNQREETEKENGHKYIYIEYGEILQDNIIPQHSGVTFVKPSVQRGIRFGVRKESRRRKK